MSLILEPYRALQDRRVKAFKEAKAAYDRAKAAREQAVSENRALPAAERQRLPSLPDEPGRPERFIVGDATVEAMAALLEWSPRGLLSTQDEGVAWVRGMNQYKGGKGNDRQFWLAAWSGTSQLVDRKSRDGEPISIPRPFINVILNLPPDMLCELADGQGRSDGFLDRILFAFPRCAGPADWSEATVDRAAKQAWEATLVRLRTLAVVEAADGLPGPQVVRLSPAARAAWVGWYDAHAAETRSPDLPAQLRGPWGKLRSYAARFILLLHYLWLVQADADEADVGAASVERAVKLIDYYKSHLRLVYSRLRQTPEDNRLSELLEWVRQQGGQSCVRHVVKARKAPTADKARQAFKELEERGFGRSEWRVGGNGRKVQWFVVDPDREVSQ